MQTPIILSVHQKMPENKPLTAKRLLPRIHRPIDIC